MLKKQDSSLSSLFSTVKKPKNQNLLHHAKSYDDIFALQQLQPSEVKVLLNNDRSIKSIKKIYNMYESSGIKNYFPTNTKKEYEGDNISQSNRQRQNKQFLSQLLQQSVKKQNILIKKQLFDPYKYFGSGIQVSSIQESTRHHQSRLQAMFSESTSPLATDHSASYRKKSPIKKGKKVNVDVHRISSSALIGKLQKLEFHQKQLKQNIEVKHILQKKPSLTKRAQKQNIADNSFQIGNVIDQNIKQLQYLSSKNQNLQKPLQQNLNYIQSKNPHKKPQFYQNSLISGKSTQNNEQSSMISSKKVSLNANGYQKYSTKQINCSPKSYVKQSKQNYLKMSLNNLQKVRLKLKLNSAKN